MAEDKEIKNFEELKIAYDEKVEKTKQDLRELMGLLKETPKSLAEATKRGIEDKIAEINTEFGKIDDIQLKDGTLQEALNNAEKWRNAHSDRNQKVTSTVTNTKQSISRKKEAVAQTAVKVTSLVGKGLVLFGQKDLAKKMQENVAHRGEAFVTKESRIGKIMERVAEGGFTVVDTKNRAVDYVKNKVNDTRTAMSETVTRADKSQEKITDAKHDKEHSNLDWQTIHDKRSKKVKQAVESIDRDSLDKREKRARTMVKVTGKIAKGLALFGQKGLAETMQNKALDRATNYVGKESLASKIAKDAAEMGFIITDDVREAGRVVKEGVVNTGKAVQKGVKDAGEAVREGVVNTGKAVRDGVKKGALQLGTHTYNGVAVIAGIGSFGLDTIDKGIDFVADKVSDGIKTADQYISTAQAKVSLQKSRSGLAFKEMIAGIANKIIEKVGPSIDKSREEISTKEDALKAKQEALNNKGKNNQELEAEGR